MIDSPLGPRPICIECAAKRQAFTTSKATAPVSAPFQKSSDTSRAAAASISEKELSRQCQQVLDCIRKYPEGIIREDISAITNIKERAVCGRIDTLRSKGLITTNGKREALSGRMVDAYCSSERRRVA